MRTQWRLATSTSVLAGFTVGLGVTFPLTAWLAVRLVDASRRASYDTLTGLANRDAARQFLERAAAARRAFAVVLVDLDGFKRVNDEYGHGAGDQLLRAVAGRLACVAAQASGLAARLGGDEFLLLVPSCGAPRYASQIERLRQMIATPVVVRGHHGEHVLTPSATVGVAPPDPRDRSWAGGLWAADVALYYAKRGRLPSAIYDSDMAVPPRGKERRSRPTR